MHGLNTPIEIGSAAMTLTPDAVSMQKISARTGSTHWSGGVTAPRHCAAPSVVPDAAPSLAQSCVFQFDLTADQLSTGDLAEWFTPHPAKRPWYRILNSSSSSNDGAKSPSPLLAIQARGNLHIGRFGMKKVFATQVATQVEVDRGKITLTALRGELLEGTHQGNWTIDVSSHDLSAHDASAQNTFAHDSSISRQWHVARHFAGAGGLVDERCLDCRNGRRKFDVEGSADSFHELLARSDGKLQFVMRNGSLTHIEIPGSPVPLPVHRFAGGVASEKRLVGTLCRQAGIARRDLSGKRNRFPRQRSRLRVDAW